MHPRRRGHVDVGQSRSAPFQSSRRARLSGQDDQCSKWGGWEGPRMTTSDWRARAGATFVCEKRPAHGARGMAVTNHPLASAAGAEMLAAGGNAIDAAVAACFTLSV